jgi:asparagine synthase (glutamine-hydrolysing)
MEGQQSPYTVRIIGYCELDKDRILQKFHDEGVESLRNLRGEYTLILEKADECFVISSPCGVMHYFYTVQNGKLYHSDRLTDILRESGLDWEWNWTALGDLCTLENLTENQSLHKQIQKIPAGAILHFHNGKTDLRSALWIDGVSRKKAEPHKALEALNEESAFWATKESFISLSGGFDSRVILSSLLKQDIKPRIITMGTEESSDVKTTRKIAKEFGLKQDLIPITLDDFFANAHDISALTNGTKTAWHWHTYVYPAKAGIGTENAFYVGTLGEFARSYYFDKGFIGQLADLLPGPALNTFWNLKLQRNWTFKQEELAGLSSEFAGQLNENGKAERVKKLGRLCHHQFLDGLSRFYLEQRVPNFYANGVKMYLASAGWRSPFHSRKWINEIWQLNSNWKLGSNWHRYAISQNLPKLLEFPEEGGRKPNVMLAKSPLLYWAPFLRQPYISYNMSTDWYRSPRIAEFLMDQTGLIADLIDKPTVEHILKAHQGGEDRTRTLAFLLTMAYWALQVKSAVSIKS